MTIYNVCKTIQLFGWFFYFLLTYFIKHFYIIWGENKMKKKILSIILALGLTTSFLAGCGNSSEKENKNAKETTKVEESSKKDESKGNYPVKIKNFDAQKNEFEVTFKQKPTKVITTNQPATEVMLALGLEDSLVGTCYRDNPILPELEEAYKKVPILSERYPSKEVVLSKKPDMLFGWGSAFFDKSLGNVTDWNKKEVNTFIQRNSVLKERTVENEFKDIGEIGKIFNVTEKSDKLISDMKAKIEDIQKKTKTAKSPVKVLVIEGSGDNKYYAYGKNSLVTDMVEKAGGTNITDKGGEISLETILEKNPDVIALISFEMQKSDNKEISALLNNKSLQNVNAIKNKKVVDTPLAETYVGGVRVANGIERLAKGFYPELFK